MSQFDINKVRLAALDYAEKNKIVNEKSIRAFVDGFKFRDKADAVMNLEGIKHTFDINAQSKESDALHDGLTGDQYSNRMLQGAEAQSISNDIQSLIVKIKKFNAKFDKKY